MRELQERRDSVASKKITARSRLVRINRRYFYNDRGCADHNQVIAKARAAVFTRRLPAFLQARNAEVVQELSTLKVYNFPNRKQLTFLSAEAHAQHSAVHANIALQATPSIVENTRSVLQHRNAYKRTVSYRYVADRVLRKLPFALSLAPKRAGRAGKRAISLLSKLEEKRNNYLRLLRYAPASKKGPYQALFTRAQRALRRARNRLATFKALQPYLPSSSNMPYTAARPQAPFTNRTFRYFATHRRFTKNCMRLQSARKAMIFDTSRPRL